MKAFRVPCARNQLSHTNFWNILNFIRGKLPRIANLLIRLQVVLKLRKGLIVLSKVADNTSTIQAVNLISKIKWGFISPNMTLKIFGFMEWIPSCSSRIVLWFQKKENSSNAPISQKSWTPTEMNSSKDVLVEKRRGFTQQWSSICSICSEMTMHRLQIKFRCLSRCQANSKATPSRKLENNLRHSRATLPKTFLKCLRLLRNKICCRSNMLLLQMLMLIARRLNNMFPRNSLMEVLT